jgi:hypothetical protein
MNKTYPTNDKFFYDGAHYFDFIDAVATELKPTSYFEIGTNAGASLAKISCDSVCVDPKFMVVGNITSTRRRTLLYQVDSDTFFSSYNLKDQFPKGVDLAFLDGMHWFEFLLRDFINTEKYCHNNSLILVHDCLPPNFRMAERTMRLDDHEDDRTKHGWTGDVWKLLPVLAAYRPDLNVRLLDCPPTGLVALSNLNPASNVLAENYHKILTEYADLSLEEFGLEKLHSIFPLVDSRKAIKGSRISAIFTVR